MNDQDFLKKFSPIITNEIARIDKLVHELLDFAKPSPAMLSPTNITHILDNTLDFLSNDFIKIRSTSLKIIKPAMIWPSTSMPINSGKPF